MLLLLLYFQKKNQSTYDVVVVSVEPMGGMRAISIEDSKNKI